MQIDTKIDGSSFFPSILESESAGCFLFESKLFSNLKREINRWKWFTHLDKNLDNEQISFELSIEEKMIGISLVMSMFMK